MKSAILDYLLIKMLLLLLSVVVVTLAHPHTEGAKLLTVPDSAPSTTTQKQGDIASINESNDSQECQCVQYDLCDEADIVQLPGLQLPSDRYRLCDLWDVCCKNPKFVNPATPSEVKKGCGYRKPHLVESLPSRKSTNSRETPWVVALMVGNTTVGAGALVHPQVVLTAAHVAAKFSNTTLIARAGDWHTQTQTDKHRLKPQERAVENIKIHKEFNKGNLWNDVALLRLQAPMELAEHIDVICVPDQGEDFDQSRSCIVNGWMRDKSGAVTLKKVEADILPSESCVTKLRRTRLGKWFKLNKSFLCAEEKEGFTCQGDGGAPLACPGAEDYKLYGLVAWGIGCGDDIPSVYAKVSMFRDWVDDTMREWGFTAEEWL